MEEKKMLKIRKEQNDELAKVALNRFEDSMVEHIKKFFPRYYEIYGESLIHDVIKYAIDRAKTYGFRSERDVCYYINTTFLLGSNFDDDLQLPWAKTTLNNKAIKSPSIKAKKLYDETLAYLDQVAGPNDEIIRRALLKISSIKINDLSNSPSPKIDQTVSVYFQNIWPEKCKYMGQTALRRLILSALRSANNYNITSERGIVLYAVLMFTFGSYFDKDPQLSWASDILNDVSMKDQITKVDRLYSEFTVFVKQLLN
ncbi:MAG: hypothetical protein ACYS3N_01125 [Planctomycetota bacterium]|jgi:hypothetical protein